MQCGIWRVLGTLYIHQWSCILEGNSNENFPFKLEVAQGCKVSPTLIVIEHNSLLSGMKCL